MARNSSRLARLEQQTQPADNEIIEYVVIWHESERPELAPGEKPIIIRWEDDQRAGEPLPGSGSHDLP